MPEENIYFVSYALNLVTLVKDTASAEELFEKIKGEMEANPDGFTLQEVRVATPEEIQGMTEALEAEIEIEGQTVN